MREFIRNQFVPVGVVLGTALILAALVGAWAALSIKAADDTVSVTGSAKQAVTSDSVKFAFTLTRVADASALGAGNAQLDSDLLKARALLEEAGVPAEEITIDPVMTSQVYDSTGLTNRYQLMRTITLNSGRVEAIGQLASSLTSALAARGVIVQANQPEYYYTKLADLRVSLLADAIKDAKARAEAIAKESGSHVGRLQSSSSGVVQILAPNSIDVSDYGQYDTSSVEKEIMVTVRATFAL